MNSENLKTNADGTDGYLALKGFCGKFGDYSLSSIRMKDCEPVRTWRNDQISALRQRDPLSKEQQLRYFKEVVGPQFVQEQPDQILLRFTIGDELIGYGGLVHLNWADKRAEVSFLLKTERSKDHELYQSECKVFMNLLKACAFTVLGLNKISTEAYAHREFHVNALERAGFTREGVLREQVKIDGTWVDSIVGSCLRSDYLEHSDEE
jgi:RimJ/RimL family protein N-acetyltransferase